ncbi:MAG: hypothetical protein ACE5G1_02460, partial [bacterium]
MVFEEFVKPTMVLIILKSDLVFEKSSKRDQFLPIINLQDKSVRLENKVGQVVKMTILEYFCGLAVLLLGFNIGFYEA